jgi:hypothetical protein
MTEYYGDFAEDDTVNIPFNTFDSNDPTASVTITNLADADIHVHKDASITQATTDGATVVINFDGITGNHMISIDTSADAFYVTGSEYAVRIEGTTIDAGTINAWVGAFSIERAGGALALIKALNDFDPANDDVAVVTLVTTTTTNTDMVAEAPTAAANADAVWDEILIGATHNIATSAGRRLRQLQESGSVYNGQVYLDTIDGVAGVVAYENGTSDNPTDLIASAKTIASNVGGGLHDFHIINGSTVLLFESTVDESYFGDNWTLQLGGQDVAGAYIQGAMVSGIGTSTTEVHYEGCDVATMSVQIGHFDFCAFSATVTMTLAGDYNYHNCYSKVAGAGAPTFTKTAGQAITAQWRNWAGGITVSGVESGDTFTINGRMGTITLNGADGTVEVRGTYKSIVDNRTGSPTLNTDGAIKGVDVASILTDTAEIGTAGAGLTDITINAASVDNIWDEVLSKAAHNVGQSGAKFLRQSADLVQIDGAVSDVAPSTSDFDTDLSEVDGYFDDSVLIFTDGAANAGIGITVNAYVNANGNMSFLSPDTWPVTPVNGDDFVIFATHVHPVAQIQDAILSDATPFQGADIPLILEDTAEMNLGIIYGVTEAGTLSTTQATTDLTGFADDELIGRVIIFTAGGDADGQASDITDYASASGLVTFTAITTLPAAADPFKIV